MGVYFIKIQRFCEKSNYCRCTVLVKISILSATLTKRAWPACAGSPGRPASFWLRTPAATCTFTTRTLHLTPASIQIVTWSRCPGAWVRIRPRPTTIIIVVPAVVVVVFHRQPISRSSRATGFVWWRARWANRGVGLGVAGTPSTDGPWARANRRPSTNLPFRPTAACWPRWARTDFCGKTLINYDNLFYYVFETLPLPIIHWFIEI